jgi:DUF2917 family protein
VSGAPPVSADTPRVRIHVVQSILFRLLPEARARECRAASGKSRLVRLRPDELLRLTRDGGIASVEVRAGLVWLTSTPANQDVLLRSGGRIDLTDDWPFVLQALAETEILLR